MQTDTSESLEKDEVVVSFGRCSLKPEFIDTFYEIFLASSPKIAPMFANTDMSKQKGLLKQGINMLLLYAKGSPTGKSAVRRLTESHSKKNLDIAPNMYPLWLDSLMKAVSITDPEFNPVLEQQWRSRLKIGIEAMKDGYES